MDPAFYNREPLKLTGTGFFIGQVRYDTRCYFNVCSKADMSRLNLPHGDDN